MLDNFSAGVFFFGFLMKKKVVQLAEAQLVSLDSTFIFFWIFEIMPSLTPRLTGETRESHRL